jgi:predicted AAA+ superfamily ATPase
LPQTTHKRYLTILETLFMVFRLPAWARNAGKRLTKSPKIFLPDCGM